MPPRSHSNANLLDPDTIRAAESLGLVARQVVEGYLAGEHTSPYRGFAVEFSEHREYTPGDDLRHLDWKLLGRTDRLYLKQYQHETNLVTHLLVDTSESMAYGSGATSKLGHAKTLAACLAYLVLHQRDAIALGVVDESLQSYLPRSNNRDLLFEVMYRLADLQPAERTNLAKALHQLANLVTKKGIFILFSDLFDDEPAVFQGLEHLREVGHEIVLVQVLDADELDFPFRGLVEFDGFETPQKILARPHEIRAAYLREFAAFRQRFIDFCHRTNSHYVLASTALPPHEILTNYLDFRQTLGRG